MMFQVFSILLVIISGILCSGTQQGASSTQTGQTLQVQPNVRKYNKHTATEKPCTTAGSPTGTRKDKPDNYSDSQDYVPIGGAAGPGYPYPYPYPYPYQPLGPYQPIGPYQSVGPYQPLGPYQPVSPYLQPAGNPYRPLQYPYEPQYAVDGAPPPPPPPPSYNYAPYYPTGPQYVAPPPPYYPAAPQPFYEQQATVVDAYRSPADQSQFFRQPAAAPGGLPPYYTSPHFRAHAYNRPPFLQQRDAAAAPFSQQRDAAAAPFSQQRDVTAASFLQQRDAAAATPAVAVASAANNAEPQYEQQQSGPFDGTQFHY